MGTEPKMKKYPMSPKVFYPKDPEAVDFYPEPIDFYPEPIDFYSEPNTRMPMLNSNI